MTADPQIWQEEIDEWYEEEVAAASPVHQTPVVDFAEKYARSQLRVVRETKDYQLDYLQHALRPGRELIDISPAYQRRLRWTTKKKSLLIESFLLNIPVPPIFLFERDYNEYEVIDGRQRLESIRGFLGNEFALAGLEYWPELNRQKFKDLPHILQRGLLRRSLSAVVLLAETREAAQDDLDVRRVLFDRLNTGGVRLNPQELRNALYPGSLNKMLIELARSAPFTQVWGIPPYDESEEENPSEALLKNALFSSLADAELVLRFFALRDAVQKGKQGSLRAIMDRYMEKNMHIDPERADGLKREFITQLYRFLEVFKGVPFRLPTTHRPSRPLYDALMIALSQKPGLDIEARAVQIREELDNALADEHSYDVLVGRGNTIEAVHERVSLAGSILRAGLQ
ncbi:DUF262 domain-containing protein [Microbispora triticiradicis]|uniref:DUF262 domain-containing protein n=2 Tax=Microbispora TaxID=2005 RepID=A0ABY3LMW0_9ACTN|nr:MULTISPECIES: DUF262 domain-containing protein [Microbispora]TLP66554.1 DUF262 domain-containing protein [Microbispora fusca]TYB43212.1 DUF262 domain-containing protein [Microbispora tritici]